MKSKIEPKKDWQELVHSINGKKIELPAKASTKQVVDHLLGIRKPMCPCCKKSNMVRSHCKTKKLEQRYYCKRCTDKHGGKRKTFQASTGSLIHYVHKKDKFIEYSAYMYENRSFTVQEGAKACNISIRTSLRFRHLFGIGLRRFLAKRKSKRGQIGQIAIAFMEKGGSIRKAPTEIPHKKIEHILGIQGSTENSGNKSSNNGANKKEVRDVEKIKAHKLDDCFTYFFLKKRMDGSLEIKVGRDQDPFKCKPILLEDSYLHAYKKELEQYFREPFRGVSTRYVCTYVCWFELPKLKLNFGDLLAEIISDRHAKADFYETERNNIWDLDTVELEIAA